MIIPVPQRLVWYSRDWSERSLSRLILDRASRHTRENGQDRNISLNAAIEPSMRVWGWSLFEIRRYICLIGSVTIFCDVSFSPLAVVNRKLTQCKEYVRTSPSAWLSHCRHSRDIYKVPRQLSPVHVFQFCYRRIVALNYSTLISCAWTRCQDIRQEPSDFIRRDIVHAFCTAQNNLLFLSELTFRAVLKRWCKINLLLLTQKYRRYCSQSLIVLPLPLCKGRFISILTNIDGSDKVPFDSSLIYLSILFATI